MPIKKRRTSSAVAGILAGGLVAVVVIACAAPGKAMKGGQEPAAMDARGVHSTEPAGAGSPRGQIAALDQEITEDMARLALPRPPAPANACTERCPSEMATAIDTAAAQPASCKPGASDKCGETCRLKDSICTAAGNICRIATELGGTDSYANDACNRGTASCDAAKQRCCSCL